nr:uncharacterized protein LOC117279458 [Nicotiana tomentosiformis]
MIVSLSARNKIAFIDGSCPEPATTSSDYKQWDRCNNMVISWLTSSLLPDIAESIQYSETAEKGLQKEKDEDKVHQFLMGLNEVYVGVRSNLLMMQHLPSLNNVHNILHQDERQRQVNSPPQFISKATFFNVNSFNKTTQPQLNMQFQGQQRQYTQRVNFDNQSRDSNIFCKYCKKPGHLIDKCFKLHVFSANFKFTKGRKATTNMVTDSDFSVSESSNQTSITLVAENASVVPRLTKQHSQLLSLLQKSHVSDPAPQLNIMSSTNFVGTLLPKNGPSLKKPLDLGKLDIGLYKFVSLTSLFVSDHLTCTVNIVSPSCNKAAMNKVDIVWHHRLAHVPFIKMKNFSLPVVSMSPLSTTSSFVPTYWSESVLPSASITHSTPLSASFPSDAPSFLSDTPSFPNATNNHPSPSYASPSPHLTDAFFDSNPSPSHPATIRSPGHLVILVVYVDDIILTGDDLHEIFALKQFLDSEFKIKDLGFLHYFLGIEVTVLPYGVVLNQKKFTSDLFKDYDCLDVHFVVSPLELNQKLKADVGDLLPNPEKYRSLVGKLLFLTRTLPDICFSVQHLSQFIQAPWLPHMIAALHFLRYLKGTPDLGFFYSHSTDFSIKVYSDSDWAACPDTRKFVSGFCIFLGDSLVGWKSKKQHMISLSSAEAEYRAVSKVVAELVWLSILLHDLTINVSFPISVFCDNMAAIHIAKNIVFHERTKHIKVDCHFIRSKLTEVFIQLSHVPTSDQLADVFTKPLLGVLHHSFLGKLKVVSHSNLKGVLGHQLAPLQAQSSTLKLARLFIYT